MYYHKKRVREGEAERGRVCERILGEIGFDPIKWICRRDKKNTDFHDKNYFYKMLLPSCFSQVHLKKIKANFIYYVLTLYL